MKYRPHTFQASAGLSYLEFYLISGFDFEISVFILLKKGFFRLRNQVFQGGKTLSVQAWYCYVNLIFFEN